MSNEALHINSFIYNLNADTPAQVLKNIAWRVGRETDIDMTWLADQLLLSEAREGSGIDGGVAIPHLKSTPLKKPHILVAKLATPVDFGAIDNQLVDIVCLVLSPQMDGVLHLRRLSRITRLFRESFVLEKLRNVASEKEMAELFRFNQPPQAVMAA
jgi:PTS system nitrogen regulatory IIA component